MSEKLKPCPFCGELVDMLYWDSEHENEKRYEPCDEENGVVFPYIYCGECDARFIFDTLNCNGTAAVAWNRRAENE